MKNVEPYVHGTVLQYHFEAVLNVHVVHIWEWLSNKRDWNRLPVAQIMSKSLQKWKIEILGKDARQQHVTDAGEYRRQDVLASFQQSSFELEKVQEQNKVKTAVKISLECANNTNQTGMVVKMMGTTTHRIK